MTEGISPIREWNKPDTEYLMQNAKTLSCAQMAEALQRDFDSVRSKCRELGFSKRARKGGYSSRQWSKLEDAYLHTAAGGKTYAEMADVLDRTVDSVKSRCLKLEIAVVRTVPAHSGARRPWTNEDQAFIEVNYPAMDCTQIAKELRRPKTTVRNHLLQLKPREWSAADDDFLTSNFDTMPLIDLAALLERPTAQIMERRRQLIAQQEEQLRLKRELATSFEEKLTELESIAADTVSSIIFGLVKNDLIADVLQKHGFRCVMKPDNEHGTFGKEIGNPLFAPKTTPTHEGLC